MQEKYDELLAMFGEICDDIEFEGCDACDVYTMPYFRS